MNIWKEKVVPKFKKIFETKPSKKTLAAEVIKAFDEAKEQHTTDFEEKKGDLQSKVVELYEASPAEVKALIKDPKPAGIKKNSAAVQKFLDELAKLEFPGATAVAEAATKFGPAYLPGPITFLFEKVASLLPEEVKEEEAPPATTEAAAETTTAEVEVKDKEIAVEAEAVPEVVAPAAVEVEKKVEEKAPEAAAEPPKV